MAPITFLLDNFGFDVYTSPQEVQCSFITRTTRLRD